MAKDFEKLPKPVASPDDKPLLEGVGADSHVEVYNEVKKKLEQDKMWSVRQNSHNEKVQADGKGLDSLAQLTEGLDLQERVESAQEEISEGLEVSSPVALEEKENSSRKRTPIEAELIAIMTGDSDGESNNDITFSGGETLFTKGVFKGQEMGPGNVKKYVENLGGKITEDEAIELIREAKRIRRNKEKFTNQEIKVASEKVIAEEEVKDGDTYFIDGKLRGKKMYKKTADRYSRELEGAVGDGSASNEEKRSSIQDVVSFDEDENSLENITKQELEKKMIDAGIMEDNRSESDKIASLIDEARTMEDGPEKESKLKDAQERLDVLKEQETQDKDIEKETQTSDVIEMLNANASVMKLEDLRTEHQKTLGETQIDWSESAENQKLRRGLSESEVDFISREKEAERKFKSGENIEKEGQIPQGPSEYMKSIRRVKEAKDAYFASVAKDEELTRKKGLLEGAKNILSTKKESTSAETNRLREEWNALKVERTMLRYSSLLENTKNSIDKAKAEEALGRLFENRANREERIDALRYKEAKGPEKFKTLSRLYKSYSKLPTPVKLSVGVILGTSIGTAVGGGVAAVGGLGVAGIAGGRVLRMAAGMTAGAFAIQEVSLNESGALSHISGKINKQLKDVSALDNPEQYAALMRTKAQDLTATQKKYTRIKMGAAFLSGFAAAGLVPDNIPESITGSPQSASFTSGPEKVLGSYAENASMPGVPFEQSGVMPVHPDLAGSPEWQGQAPGATEPAEVSKFSTEVKASSEGAIADLENLKGKLAEQFKDTPVDRQPDTVKYMLATDAKQIAEELGMYDPSNPNGADSAKTKAGQSFVYSPDGTISLRTPGVEQSDVLLSDDKISMNGSIIKDGYGGDMFNWRKPELAMPETSPEPLAYTPDSTPSYQPETYVETPPVENPTRPYIAEPYSGPDAVPNAEYQVPTKEHESSKWVFKDETTNRFYYYNHPGSPHANPFGMNLPAESYPQAQAPVEQAPVNPSPLEQTQGQGAGPQSATEYIQQNPPVQTEQIQDSQVETSQGTQEVYNSVLHERYGVSSEIKNLAGFDLENIQTTLFKDVSFEKTSFQGIKSSYLQMQGKPDETLNIMVLDRQPEKVIVTSIMKGETQGRVLGSFNKSTNLSNNLVEALDKVEKHIRSS